MRTANQDPALQARPFKRMVAAATLAAMTLAGCTAEPRIGTAESTTAPSASVPQIAGQAALGLVYVANPNGHDQIFEQPLDAPNEPPTPLTDASCDSNNPQASPDGSLLVYYADCGSGNQIYTFDLHSRTQTQLTGDAHVQNYDPTFSLGPAGELEIDWKQTDGSGNYGELWEMPVGGSARYNLTPGLIRDRREAWKPSSVNVTQRLLTVREHQGDPSSDGIFSLDIPGHTMQRLASGWFPAYNPTQNNVVFIRKQDGHDVLATMNLDGTDQRVVVDMPGDSDDPSWTPDGGTVVFINNGGGKYSVYAYHMATGQRTLLYDGNKYGRALAPIVVPAAG